MRKKIVAGNWKMNLSKMQALELARAFDNTDFQLEKAEVCVFSPSVYLDALTSQNYTKISVGSQNFYPAQSGAFTGEISISHLQDLTVKTVLIGHSERRLIFGETHEFIKAKVDTSIASKMKVFFCCGEPEEIRDQNKQNQYVENQLRESLLHLSNEHMHQVVIAYEPVWAIGTGKTASNEQANEMHKFIRSIIEKTHGKSIADSTRILYGGSCNATNASGLFSMSDIDGGLIGGASLQVEDFKTIISAAQ